MIDRRRFIGTSIAGGAAAAALGTSACAPDGSMSGSDADVGMGAGSTRPGGFELDESTVADLQAAMESGERTARSITELYLERIAALDGQGPELRSVIETNPEALDIADQLDQERQASGPRGPLHGIPVALKDNLDTHDRMTTTAGSLALEGSIPPQDSFVAERLREAGAPTRSTATRADRVPALAWRLRRTCPR